MDFNQKLENLIDRASFLVQDPTTDQPAAYFVANHFMLRAIRICPDIQTLREAGSTRNAWALFRMLVDRQVLLRHLVAKEEFDKFQTWSLACRYHDLNALKKTGKFSGDDESKAEETIRAIREQLGNEPEQPSHYWKKPRSRELFFVPWVDKTTAQVGYLKTYQMTSALIHPVHDDSQEDGLGDQTLVPNTYFAFATLLITGFLAVERHDLSELIMLELVEALGVSCRNMQPG